MSNTMTTVEAGLTAAETRFATFFVRLWALSHVIHLFLATDSKLDAPWNIATTVAAMVLLLRPTSGAWLVTLAVAQIADMVAEMPFSADHWMVMGFINFAVLCTMARRRSWGLESLVATFPAARLILLVSYSAAALAKYNTDFLDPVGSCADALASAGSFGLTGNLDVGPLFALSVMAAEASIPILLAIPATRRHGVRIGVMFHFALTASPLIGVEDFSATVYALFILFLTSDEVDAIVDRIRRFADRSAVVRDARRAPWVTVALAFALFGFVGYLSLRVAMAVTAVFSTLFLLAVLVAVLLTWRSRFGRRSFGRVLWVQVPAVVLTALWVASPYVGLRTSGVMTMYSNLQTEEEADNHLFMPTVDVFDFQQDLVVIESSNHHEIDGGGDGDLGIPLHALRRYATDHPDLVVEGRLHGEDITFGPGPGQVELEPLPWWEHKVLLFRPVDADGSGFCGVG